MKQRPCSSRELQGLVLAHWLVGTKTNNTILLFLINVCNNIELYVICNNIFQLRYYE